MYHNETKKDISKFVAKCQDFEQVKVEHQKLSVVAQNISIPTWKWEYLSMVRYNFTSHSLLF